jgi:hypothetical protein
VRLYRTATQLLSGLLVLLGLALCVRGAVAAQPVGLIVGALFVLAGGGRLYLARRG